jgi:hypothetical protein
MLTYGIGWFAGGAQNLMFEFKIYQEENDEMLNTSII